MIPDLNSYERILVALSGGKDSIACYLYLKELGVDMNKVEIHHHAIDGRESTLSFMDWPVTPAYCRAFAKHFDARFYESWRGGGFYGHMMRSNQPPAPVYWENCMGGISFKEPANRPRNKECGVCGELCYGCIGKFPQVTADLRLRWCSSALTISAVCG